MRHFESILYLGFQKPQPLLLTAGLQLLVLNLLDVVNFCKLSLASQTCCQIEPIFDCQSIRLICGILFLHQFLLELLEKEKLAFIYHFMVVLHVTFQDHYMAVLILVVVFYMYSLPGIFRLVALKL